MLVNKERWSRNSIKKFISTENPNFAVHMNVPAGLPLNLWPRDSQALRVPSHPAVSLPSQEPRYFSLRKPQAKRGFPVLTPLLSLPSSSFLSADSTFLLLQGASCVQLWSQPIRLCPGLNTQPQLWELPPAPISIAECCANIKNSFCIEKDGVKFKFYPRYIPFSQSSILFHFGENCEKDLHFPTL